MKKILALILILTLTGCTAKRVVTATDSSGYGGAPPLTANQLHRFGAGTPVTPNLGLNTPAFGTPRWDLLMNANFTSLDAYLSGGSVLPGPGLQINGALSLSRSGTTFASLPVGGTFAQNGTLVFCLDCQQQTPCVASGAGAFAQRIAGVWNCSSGTGAAANVIVNNPSTSQPLTQPFISGTPTSFDADVFNRIFYVPSPGNITNRNWTASPGTPASLTGASPATVSLTTCPEGLEATSGNDFVLVGGTGTEETPIITATTCTVGGGSAGTVTFTPLFSHSAGYTVGSATAGAQETLNAASLVSNVFPSPNARIIFPSTSRLTATWKAPLWLPANRFTLDFTGYVSTCAPKNGRACIVNSKQLTRLVGYTAQPGLNFAPIAVTATALTSNVATLTTSVDPATAGIGVGSYICTQKTDQQIYWGCDFLVTAVTSSSISYPLTGVDIGSQTTPGVVMLENSPFISLGTDTKMENTRFLDGVPSFFNTGVLVFNDQDFVVTGALNNQAFVSNSLWTSPVFFAPGPSANSAVMSLYNLNLSLGCHANGVLYYGGNHISIRDSVIQGQAEYLARVQSIRGGFPSFTWDNISTEVGTCSSLGNPTGNVGQEGLGLASVTSTYFASRADINPQGWMPQYANTGATKYAYWLVVHNPDFGVSLPLYFGWAASNGSGTIALSWPRIRGINASSSVQAVAAITYDVLRTTFTSVAATPSGTGNFAVATGLTQCAGFVCTVNDTNSAPSSYTVAATTYYPMFDHWPGSVVLGTPSNTSNINTAKSLFKTSFWGGNTYQSVGSVISVVGNKIPTIIADYCAANTAGDILTSVLEQCNNLPFRESGFATLSTGLATVNLLANYASTPTASCNNPNQSGAPIACSIFCTTTSCTIKSGSGADVVSYQVEGSY